MSTSLMINTAIRPPLAGWRGGESRLAKTIIPKIPSHTCYIEPFAGAAWVFFRKQPSRVEVLNDINKDVINLSRCIQYHHKELIRSSENTLVSRDEFERLKSINPDTLTDIQRAVKFYYLQQQGYMHSVLHHSFGYDTVSPPRLNLQRIEKHLATAHSRLRGVYLECLPYEEIIRRYNKLNIFFYVDPPYWGCENHYGKNIFSKQDFVTLAGLLKRLQGTFILSLNDTEEVRGIISDFYIESVTTMYSLNREKNTKAAEVLISNFKC